MDEVDFFLVQINLLTFRLHILIKNHFIKLTVINFLYTIATNCLSWERNINHGSHLFTISSMSIILYIFKISKANFYFFKVFRDTIT